MIRVCIRDLNSRGVRIALLFVVYAVLANQALAQGFSFPAVVVTRDRAVLSAEIPGTLVRLPAGTGAAFKRGDVLVEFDCRLMRLNRDKVAHERDAAQKKHENASQLGKMASAGQLTVDLAMLEWKRAETELESADLMVKRCTILAPFDGAVVRIQPQLHETVAAGQAIIEIAGFNRVEIEAAVPANFALKIAQGQSLSFAPDGAGEKARVVVTGIAPVIDPVSQLVNLRARIEESPTPISPGMTGSLGRAQ